MNEACARARRRYLKRLAALGVLGILLAGGAIWIGRSQGPGGSPATRSAAASVMSRSSVWPTYFADNVEGAEGNSELEIRASATGRLVEWLDAPQGAFPKVLALTATGTYSFVVALQKGSARNPQTGCATQLYRVRLSGHGAVRVLKPIGRALPGLVVSLAASAGGRVVGFALIRRPCAKGSAGDLGVLDVASGRTRQWSDLGLDGVSFGNLGLSGALSMSTNGQELAFPVAVSPPHGAISAYEVRILRADAPGGTVAARSRTVLRHSGYLLDYGAAVLSPNGRSFYLESSGYRSKLVIYRTATSKPYRTLATFDHVLGGIALDPSGRWLLVPYQLDQGTARTSWRGTLHVARINTASDTRADFTVALDGFGGMSPPAGIDPAW